jgi:4-oxalocrotonate tautomerase
MPFVQVKLIEGVFDDAQKREMASKVTEAMIAVEGENMRPVTWVVIEEVKSGDWWIGGTAKTADDVKALKAGAGGHSPPGYAVDRGRRRTCTRPTRPQVLGIARLLAADRAAAVADTSRRPLVQRGRRSPWRAALESGRDPSMPPTCGRGDR